MARCYEGKLGSLEFKIMGDEQTQDLLTLSNYIMYSAKIFELNGEINTQEKSFIAMCKKIREKKYQWTFVENRILGQIEKYIENNKYTINENDVCYGSLKYLSTLYDITKEVDYVQRQRVEKNLQKMEKVIEQTFALEELKFSGKNSNMKQNLNPSKATRRIINDDDFSRSKINCIRKLKRNKEIKRTDKEDMMEYFHN